MFDNSRFGNCLFRRGWMLAPAFFLAVAAFGQQPAGVSNFHIVDQQVYRGAQPTSQGFESLAKMGVKTVIDLREADDLALAEKKQVEADGMRFVNIPMRGMHRPTPADVARALALFGDTSSGPVFVHCKRGADRTGTVVACYRISRYHWENHKALDEARTYGMSWFQRAMMHYVLGYRPPVQHAGAEAASAGN
jgi:tyrosine-protein phosphatase SIW14